MSEPKFTPGPWEVKRALRDTDGACDYGVGADVGGKKLCIAETFGRVDVNVYPPAEANAHLIAAAPDLYGALKAMADRWEPDCFGTDRAMWEDARAALAKARGEAS